MPVGGGGGGPRGSSGSYAHCQGGCLAGCGWWFSCWLAANTPSGRLRAWYGARAAGGCGHDGFSALLALLVVQPPPRGRGEVNKRAPSSSHRAPTPPQPGTGEQATSLLPPPRPTSQPPTARHHQPRPCVVTPAPPPARAVQLQWQPCCSCRCSEVGRGRPLLATSTGSSTASSGS